MNGARRRRLSACLLALALSAAGVASAQDQPRRPVTGRTAVSGRTAATVSEETTAAPQTGWCFGLAAGVLAGGDLFQVANDLTVPWSPPAGVADFNAKRFTVTLDEAAAVGLAAAKRLTPRGWLRLDLTFGRMDAAALANDSQFVTPVLYDRWNVVQLDLAWEQRLTDTRLQPLVRAGLSYTGISATADAADQSVPGLLLGAGFAYRGGPRWSLGLDLADHIQQFTLDGLPQEQDFPSSSEYREFGPQHLVTVTVRYMAHF